MTGQVGILNVGAGDIKLSFDKNNMAERIRAARIVTEMLRRGYALLIEYEEGGVKKHRRATGFDGNTCEYIIVDYDPTVAATAEEHSHEEGPKEASLPETSIDAGPKLQRQKARAPIPKVNKRKTRIDAATATGVAVSRTAGG